MNNTCCAVLNTWHELNVSPFLNTMQRFVVISYSIDSLSLEGENPAKVCESCKICCEKSKNKHMHAHTLRERGKKHKLLACCPLIPRIHVNRNLLMTLIPDAKYPLKNVLLFCSSSYSPPNCWKPLSFTTQESVNATEASLLHYSSNQIKIWNIIWLVCPSPISPRRLPLSPSSHFILLQHSGTPVVLIPCNALLC